MFCLKGGKIYTRTMCFHSLDTIDEVSYERSRENDRTGLSFVHTFLYHYHRVRSEGK